MKRGVCVCVRERERGPVADLVAWGCICVCVQMIDPLFPPLPSSTSSAGAASQVAANSLASPPPPPPPLSPAPSLPPFIFTECTTTTTTAREGCGRHRRRHSHRRRVPSSRHARPRPAADTLYCQISVPGVLSRPSAQRLTLFSLRLVCGACACACT